MTPEERNAVLEEAAALLDAHVREGRVLHGAAVAAAAGWIRALKQAQPGVPEGGAPREPWGPRVRLLLAQAWKRNDERGAYGMLDVLTAGLEQLAKDMERASASAAPPAPHPDEDSPPSVDIRVTTLLAAQREKFRPAPHPEVVDRSLVEELAGALREALRRCTMDRESMEPLYAPLERYDALSPSPPSLLRTAEQERAGVLRHAAELVADMELGSDVVRVRRFIERIERGDHLQTPGSEGEG
jgi:hypothetical protein